MEGFEEMRGGSLLHFCGDLKARSEAAVCREFLGNGLTLAEKRSEP